MQHKVFGKLKFDPDDDSWAGKRRFPEFLPFRETPHRGKAPTTFELFVGAKDEEPPSPAQVLAFQFFVEREKNVCGTIIDAVFRWYVRRRKQDREWFEEQDCPEIDKADWLRDLMTFQALRVRRDEFEGTALTGFSFACKWDEEHGLGVLVHRGTVLDVGQADVAFHDASAVESVWLKTCTAAEKKAAQAVLKALRAARPGEASSPSEEEQIQRVYGTRQHMEQYFKLKKAIQKGDQKRIRELAAKGVSINGVPDDTPAPLFVAVYSGNVDLVKMMLELGADPQVTFYGETPLRSALHAIKLYEHRPSGSPIDDRLKDRHDGLTEIVQVLREAGGS
ncbi:MAG TPA: ankyrin repeat domain-containing protein [Pirellulales bacterium]|nr:ankyrin repeat domain-containing protein [Pirellulales bacterium]